MRSRYTIALIVPISLASYGKVHAANPPGIWCTGQTVGTSQVLSIPDPSSNYPNVQCSAASTGEPCLVDPAAVIAAINSARAKDTYYINNVAQPALGNLILPGAPGSNVQFPDFYQYLTQDEKIVVLINLERTARGLSPFPIQDQYPPAPYGHPALTWEAHNHAALLAEFYQLAQGNNTATVEGQTNTPLVHANSIDGTSNTRIESIPGFTQSAPGVQGATGLTPSPAYEAEAATQNAENAVYGWLYQDGPNWGHRHGLLGVPDSTSDHCATQIGAGFAASANEAVAALNQFNNYNLATSSGFTPYTVPPPTFFYIVDFVGQETSGWQLPSLPSYSNTASSTYLNTLTPSPLTATVVYNPASGSTPPGAPPPANGNLSVYIGFQPYPFGSGPTNTPGVNSIASVYVYPAPDWVATCPTLPAAQDPPIGFACPSPQNSGTLGAGGTECDAPGNVGTLGTGWAVYQCSVPAPSATGYVVIVRDAYDQFACLQTLNAPLSQQLPIEVSSSSPGSGLNVTPSGMSVTVATDSCGMAPLLPYAPSH
jgi:hypothetical protein